MTSVRSFGALLFWLGGCRLRAAGRSADKSQGRLQMVFFFFFFFTLLPLMKEQLTFSLLAYQEGNEMALKGSLGQGVFQSSCFIVIQRVVLRSFFFFNL